MIITAARHGGAQAATCLPQLAGRCCSSPSGCDIVACLTQEPTEPLGRLESLPPGLAEFLLPGGGAGGGAGAGDVYRNRAPARCLRSISFWLLLFVNGACAGAGLTLLNNMAQLARPDSDCDCEGIEAPKGVWASCMRASYVSLWWTVENVIACIEPRMCKTCVSQSWRGEPHAAVLSLRERGRRL